MAPTGYTCDIENGISFKDFLFTCARAFGACISLRDDALSPNLPDEFKPSDYHQKQLDHLRKEMKKFQGMDLSEAKILFNEEKKKKQSELTRYIKEKKLLKKKYEKMLKEVHKWIPPTSEHVGLKEFMIQQISESIKFDCNVYPEIYKMESKTPKQWIKNKIENILEDQLYHEKNHQEEVDRTNARSKWIQDLKKSIE